MVEVDVAVVGELPSEPPLGVLRHEPAVEAGDRGLGDAEPPCWASDSPFFVLTCALPDTADLPLMTSSVTIRGRCRADVTSCSPAPCPRSASHRTSTDDGAWSGPGSSAGTPALEQACRRGRCGASPRATGTWRRSRPAASPPTRCPCAAPRPTAPSSTSTAAASSPRSTPSRCGTPPGWRRHWTHRSCMPDYPLTPEHTWQDSHADLVRVIQRAAETRTAWSAWRLRGGRRGARGRPDGARPGGPQPTHLLLHSPWVDLTTTAPPRPPR